MADLQLAKNKLEVAEEKLVTQKAETQSVRQELAQLKITHETTLQQLDETQRYLRAAHEDYKWTFLTRTKRESALEGALDEERVKFQSARQELTQLQNTYDALLRNRDSWKAALEKSKENFTECVQSYKEQIADLEELQRQITEQLNDALVSLQYSHAKVEDLEKDNGDLKRKLDAANEELRQANRDFGRVHDRLDGLQTGFLGEARLRHQVSHLAIPGCWPRTNVQKEPLRVLAEETSAAAQETSATMEIFETDTAMPTPGTHIAVPTQAANTEASKTKRRSGLWSYFSG
ncbi:hypothetical protein B0T21DRAFT_447544 [Apiosordaria backusii]|uniref:Uncharacterized protein n=1 Tax=Apiosordaria backusii TaxID=314023 RepID=A0AA40ERV1_9PEZI|nr:hypothetical protein B0T21DRAFT_447544 [Apiosordaria backusii]